ncbi:MAG: electron transfer flavoprotein subunit alpha/FixB family protein [Acidobacteria bacterium]|nr:electron transfer flavoprotein subunit alpha/FixB family protein [Acidobacteriota bacterium]
MATVLVFAESRDGKLKKVAFECLGEGRRIAQASGGTVAAVVVGANASALAAELCARGADVVCTVSDPRLALYAPMAYARALREAAVAVAADIVLIPASAMGKDLAARLAARLDTAVAADCVAISEAGGRVTAVRPVYSGKAMATVSFQNAKPAVVTLRPNVFAPAGGSPGKGEVRALQVSFGDGDFAARTTSVKLPEGAEVDVAEADIVVSGGRAMKGPENFSYIRDLAGALGGSVGASRAAVDAGWIDHSHQVGQTGKVVSPKLYVACGISGAIQHLAGMSSSKVIVAINKDPEAPIFKIADYGIVGDLYALLPLLVQEIRKLKAS